MTQPIEIAVDMDDVVAEWSQAVEREVRLRLPHVRPVPMAERRHFYIRQEYPEAVREEVYALARKPGFYESLRPVPGALETLREWRERGHGVVLLTAPQKGHPTCAQEKVNWVRKHLGPDWGEDLVIAYDKTRYHADYLIDDRPEIPGRRADPSWIHVKYDRPYNRHVPGLRMTWDTWGEAFQGVL